MKDVQIIIIFLFWNGEYVKVSEHTFKRFTSRLLKISFSLYATITSDECHAWFHLNAASPAARNTEQVNITKQILPTVGFEPQTPHGLQITSSPLSQLGHNCQWSVGNSQMNWYSKFGFCATTHTLDIALCL